MPANSKTAKGIPGISINKPPISIVAALMPTILAKFKASISALSINLLAKPNVNTTAPTNAAKYTPNSNVVSIIQGYFWNKNPPKHNDKAEIPINIANLSAALTASSRFPPTILNKNVTPTTNAVKYTPNNNVVSIIHG